MSRKLSGKVAVVTGASKGIGAEIARQLGKAGAAVIVNYANSEAGAKRVVDEIISDDGKAVALQADLAKPPAVSRLFAEVKKAFGRLDVLVNNAGIYELGPLSEVTPESFRRTFDLNVLGLLLATQEATKLFGDEGGSIINISSIVARAVFPNSSVYSASKAAVNSLTATLAVELGPRRIRVNSINPGMVETEGLHATGIVGSDMQKQVEAQSALGRIGQPNDIAPLAVFLASADASWITGESFYVTGGAH